LLAAPATSATPEGPRRDRGNDVLQRELRKPTYSLAAIARFDTQLGNSQSVMQPYGFGFAAHIRIHALAIGRTRLGGVFHGGYSRWSERHLFSVPGDDQNRVTRSTLLYHVDLSLGPSLEIPAGPVFVIVDGSAGVGISGFQRPLSSEPAQDQTLRGADPLLRGGLALGVPIRNNHGIVLGAEFHKLFSERKIESDPDPNSPAGEANLAIFDMHVAGFVGYQLWF
jgi:hypothetical protein